MPTSEREKELRRRRKRRKERVKARIRELIATAKKSKRRPAKPKSDTPAETKKSEDAPAS